MASRPERLSELSARVAVECACGGLRRASRAISRFYEGAFAPLELTATQFSILVAVHLRGPFPLSRLAEGLVLDRTTLYRAVKPLVRRRCLGVPLHWIDSEDAQLIATAVGRSAGLFFVPDAESAVDDHGRNIITVQDFVSTQRSMPASNSFSWATEVEPWNFKRSALRRVPRADDDPGPVRRGITSTIAGPEAGRTGDGGGDRAGAAAEAAA